jgi:hypothetical protein
VFHRYRQLSCGATITSPLDLTLNAARSSLKRSLAKTPFFFFAYLPAVGFVGRGVCSLRGGFSELRHHVNGNVWALLKHDAIALGTACQLVDDQPGTFPPPKIAFLRLYSTPPPHCAHPAIYRR